MPLPRLPALTARESRRRSGRHTEVQLPAAGLVRYLALLASVGGMSSSGCAGKSLTVRLENASLAERCDVARKAAKTELPDSIPDSLCAKTLASVQGRPQLRVVLVKPVGADLSSSYLFRQTETCSWPDMDLVSVPLAQMPASMGGVVELTIMPEVKKGVPFQVGVVTRQAEMDAMKGILHSSPCGTVPGLMTWDSGAWRVSADPDSDWVRPDRR
jgi:hypothetical protein